MNWNKLKKRHYHKDPVEYIHAVDIFDLKEYDKLYENQNNLDHELWQEFDAKHKTGFEFHDDITKINKNKQVMALWFFPERSDRGARPHLDLQGKRIPYTSNTFLLTKFSDIKIMDTKRKFIRRPSIQLDIYEKKFRKIIEGIK